MRVKKKYLNPYALSVYGFKQKAISKLRNIYDYEKDCVTHKILIKHFGGKISLVLKDEFRDSNVINLDNIIYEMIMSGMIERH